MKLKIAELLEQVTVGESSVLDVTGPPGDRKLEVKARKLLPEEPRAPKRAESPVRRHEFLSADSLAAYLSRYGTASTVVFADPQGECVSAVIDERAPDGLEVVTMRPQVHPLWKPWADLAGKRVPLAAFVEFVSQNRRSIVTPPGRDLVLLLSQVTASVSVQIQKGRGKTSVNGITVTTQIEGRSQSEPVDLPESIFLDLPLYVQTKRREVELDLCVEATPGGEVVVLVTAGTVAEARVEAFEEMIDVIRVATDHCKAVLTYGRPQHAPWVYLPEASSEKSAAAAPAPAYPR